MTFLKAATRYGTSNACQDSNFAGLELLKVE